MKCPNCSERLYAEKSFDTGGDSKSADYKCKNCGHQASFFGVLVPRLSRAEHREINLASLDTKDTEVVEGEGRSKGQWWILFNGEKMTKEPFSSREAAILMLPQLLAVRLALPSEENPKS